jgi:hypothetical protein
VDAYRFPRDTAAMNADLHAFVRDALARGVGRDAIREALREARWAEDEIESALGAWHDAGLGLPVPRRRVGFSPREAFLYLLLFVALYLVAYHTGAILFAMVERAWPDPALDENIWNRAREWLRFSLASLLVAFPVYLLTARITGRAVARDPEKRNSGVRRWLTYLTLFNAACVLIGDFIAVLLGLLKGELTARFTSKAAVVAAIAGWLFAHYLGGLRRDEEDPPRAAGPSWWARAAGVVVLAVTVAGLVLAGSPAVARKQILDQRRLRELQMLSNAVNNFYGARQRLPADLTEMVKTGAHPEVSLRDPVTRERYPYQVVDSVSYELCATFDAADSLGPHESRPSEFWRHGAGSQCFRFTVNVPTRRP